MPDLYLKDPKTGEVVVFDEADAQAAANAGYQEVDQATYAKARAAEARQAPASQGVASGVLKAPADYDQTSAFAEKVYSGLTFGQGAQINTPEARARGKAYETEHPIASMAGEALGQTPYVLAGGAVGQGIRGAAAVGGLAARAGAFGADIAINSAIGGAQIEGEQARVAGENFSFTDAALAGVATEVLGRSAAWGISKGVGGARNLITRAARDAVAADAERTLSKGGWVGDYRVAQHAEAYHDELADLGARDLDTLETATAEVGRQDKKRARIMRSVVENPAAQHEINVSAVEGLQRLRGALTEELESAGGGPAKRLAKQLDDRIAALEEAPKGRKLWRILDENRQALQEYRQDLHQAYDTNPGSAWLSREGLAAIDAAEEATRTSLLREDAWGEAAARMQREYNVPFHEKWFPARKTVLADLHFATGKDAQGFTTYRGEPGKVRKFLTGLGGTGPDTHRLREAFTQYLDGAEAIARAGERDSPKAAREALESVRRLRKNIANSTFINAAAERTASRGAVAGVVGAAAAGGVGLAVGGPIGGAGGVLAARSARLGHWFGQVANRLGMFSGKVHSMAELLAKDALPHADAKAVAEGLTDRLADDIMDSPFPLASDVPKAGAQGAIRGAPVRGVGTSEARRAPDSILGLGGPNPLGEVFPKAGDIHTPDVGHHPAPRGVGVNVERPEALNGPGPGQVGRQDSPRRPAGMEAITPQGRPVSVGPAGGPPRGGFPEGRGFPDERPTDASSLARTATERPEAGEGFRKDPAHWADDRRAEIGRTPTRRPAGGGGWERMEPPTPGAGASEFGESAMPSLHEGSEVPLPGELHVNETPTFPTPYRTAGAADLEARLAPHAGAQSREAARMLALTEGEFAHVVDGLNATGAKAPDGTLLGDFIRKHSDDLKLAGLIGAGAGATALASDDTQPGVAGASAGLGLALIAGRVGKRMPGSWFAGHSGPVKTALGALEKLGFETSQPVANMLRRTFGERMPGTLELEKMMPIRALEDLGGPAVEQRIVRVGDDVHWYAEGAEGPMPPHEVRLPDGTVDQDPGGYPAPSWKMGRTFTKEPNGDLIVHHDYFYLRHDLQGTGAGADILKHQMEAYRELGVKTVEVSCDDVGRYFWPSIGFDSADKRVVAKAIAAYRRWVVATGRAEAGPELTRHLTAVRSMPMLANLEHGKDFLLSTRGDWNMHLELHLDDADPRFHLMRQRLGMGEAALGAGVALAGAIEGAAPKSAENSDGAGAPAGASMGFVGAAALFKQARGKLVADVARRLFSPTVGRLATRLAARQVYSRADLAKRQKEFQSWQENPQELVDRVAEGFRDAPPEVQPKTHAGVFAAATFLKERLPQTTKSNAISMRDLPVSTEQLVKYARYEDAALRPKEAWADAAARGHISPELMETTEALHSDLLAELRVAAYMTVRDEGPPVSVQARLQYAALFGGDGSFADPAMGKDVATMSALAYQQAVPTKPGGGPTSSGNVSRVAQASAVPAGLARLG